MAHDPGTIFRNRLLNHITYSDIDEAKSLLNLEKARIYCNFEVLLYKVAQENIEAIARHLLDLGTNVDCSGRDGKTPLILALTWRCAETVKVLLEANASIDKVISQGVSVMDFVFRSTQPSPAVDPTADKFKTLRVFFQEVKSRRRSIEESVEELLNANCSLYLATLSKDKDLLECMLNRGVNINSKGSHEKTALLAAAELDDLQLVKWLTERNADVNLLDADGKGPLFISARNRNKAMLQFLLEQGADPNALDSKTRSTALFALYTSPKQENEEIVNDCVELLLQNGAVLQMLMKRRDTIFDHASVMKSMKGFHCMVAHLAMVDKHGSTTTKIRMRCDLKLMEAERYYQRCQKTLDMNVIGNSMLSDLINDSEFCRLRRLARNEQLIAKIKDACSEEHEIAKWVSYYSKTLMIRILNFREMVKLEDEAVRVVCDIFRKNYNESYVASRMIVAYLTKGELEQLCLVCE